jgi:predicted nuclease of predicted toxin-antitoxin system
MPRVRRESGTATDDITRVKLLLDQNLSHLLARRLCDVFPGSAHVRDFGMQTVDDQEVWDFARDHQYVIVSKDADFRQMSFLHGAPPKVVWLNVGNCSTTQVEEIIRKHVIGLIAFERDQDAAFLILP